MAVETLTATGRGPLTVGDNRQVPEATFGINSQVAAVEVSADASATSTYHMARIPANARLLGASTISIDDLASTGSPTLDIGLFAVDSNITDDDDAINDGIDAATAATGTALIKSIDDIGKRAWEIAGASADPYGFVDVKVTIKDAATNTGGTIVTEIFYTVD